MLELLRVWSPAGARPGKVELLEQGARAGRGRWNSLCFAVGDDCVILRFAAKQGKVRGVMNFMRGSGQIALPQLAQDDAP